MLPGTERLLAELDAAAQLLGRSTWTIVTSCTRPLFEARWATTGLPLRSEERRVGKECRSGGWPDAWQRGAKERRRCVEEQGTRAVTTRELEETLTGVAS